MDLLFAHWPVPAAALRPLVPEPLAIQEFDGTSWVGLVPFRMEGVMRRHLPDLPWISAFPEMNLRLYVEIEGRPGVWFISLDATNPLAVWAARRFFHLPYFHADMELRAEGERIHYVSRRKDRAARVEFRGTYWPTTAAYESKPGTLEHFLTERYCLYAQARDGSILRGEVHHVPWPLQGAAAKIEVNEVAGPHRGSRSTGRRPFFTSAGGSTWRCGRSSGWGERRVRAFRHSRHGSRSRSSRRRLLHRLPGLDSALRPERTRGPQLASSVAMGAWDSA